VTVRSVDFDSAPGTYVLVLRSDGGPAIRIGRLGSLRPERGFYAYVGSAFGPGGLRARLAHHQRRARRPRWHIDYLKRRVRPAEVWYSFDARRVEHDWAGLLKSAPGATIPLAGFGSSDCDCESHLFFFRERPSRRSFVERLKRLYPASEAVRYVEWAAPTIPTS
jgi:Uri superfamily endonuclease